MIRKTKTAKSRKRPLILVTNDDGITSPGIRALIEAVNGFGELLIVAPDSPQSGMGHAITISKPLRLDKVELYPGHQTYQCSGTPVDCVKLAVDKILLRKRKPDLLVSGINHGSNSSINVLYSGTMSAAVEGAIEGIPSAGFSLCDYRFNADFTASQKVVKVIAANLLKYGMPKHTLLNVNIPKVSPQELQGLKVCRQAMAKWEEDFNERVDPNGRRYFWLTGKFINNDKGKDTDEWALANNFASVVPVEYDLTAHEAIADINNWDLDV